MADHKANAYLSLDLDNEWSYLKIHGNESWKDYPSFLTKVIPRFLDLFSRRNLHVTVFIVGRDISLGRDTDALRSIPAHGHEVGNHSYEHESWLHQYNEADVEAEIEAAEREIEQLTGARPYGFRGPGYSLSETVLKVLVRRGYRYDASTIPTILGPVARWYYFLHAKLTEEQTRVRKELFGTFRDGVRPIKPYLWSVGDASLLEIPVTTFPLFRVPIHLSYITYLATHSRAFALAYWEAALVACRLTGVSPSILLHSLDFLGAEDISSLKFFPGMQMRSAEKISLVDDCLALLQKHFSTRMLREMILREPVSELKLREPLFYNSGVTVARSPR